MKVYEALIEAGEEFGIGDFGTYAINCMRLEHGFRMWGAEVGCRFSQIQSNFSLDWVFVQ